MKNQSEVARIREQIDLELDALEAAMYGPAIVGKHEVITHRMSQLGVCMEDLTAQVGEDKAIEEIYEKYNRL